MEKARKWYNLDLKSLHILIVICAMLAAALADKALNGPLTFSHNQFLEHDFIKTKYQSGPIFTNAFPKFSPSKRAMNAFGAFSRPSKTASFHVILPVEFTVVRVWNLNFYKLEIVVCWHAHRAFFKKNFTTNYQDYYMQYHSFKKEFTHERLNPRYYLVVSFLTIVPVNSPTFSPLTTHMTKLDLSM